MVRPAIYTISSQQIKQNAVNHVMSITREDGLYDVKIELHKEERSLPQNDKFQPMCREISKKVEWSGQKLSEDDWRGIFVAAIRKQRVVPGIDGGVVVLGASSKSLSKEEASDMIEMIYAFGVENGIKWTD